LLKTDAKGICQRRLANIIRHRPIRLPIRLSIDVAFFGVLTISGARDMAGGRRTPIAKIKMPTTPGS
jgi:hypothetical protein